MTDPFVWVPTAIGTIPAATAAADPIADPPGVRPRFHGLTVGPGCKNASSAVTVFPNMIAPALSKADTTSEFPRGMRPANSGEPCSVGIPAVSKMSLTPIGIPLKGKEPVTEPASASLAQRLALSGSSQVNACSHGSTFE